ncbi:bisanhydrobacterioruberin hydratase [Candidatus Nanosalina sp. VS9-1]|uniref:bisanhydrobacterioruberin hydratase n=1 Tax=Candidatus Nanosalina sp. VS9-1 TaxID=3388566 RepID=UPI0039E060F9
MDRLEKLVSDNRFTISIIFPLAGALTFLASAENFLPEILRFNPLFILSGTLVMRLPLIAGLKPLVDRKAALGLSIVAVYAYVIEFIGLKTGWPYGNFEYLVELGPMISGVPLGLPLFFIPLVLNAYLLSNLFGFKKIWKRFATSLLLVLAVDAVLDPAAVSLGIWQYSSGLFYGVPVSNFLGWILSASVVLFVLEYVFEASEIRERLENTEFMLDDFVSFVFLWGIVNLYYLNMVPVIFSVAIGLLLYRVDRFSFAFEA